MKTAERWPDQEYWRVRSERAIAANLIQTNAALQAQSKTLSTIRCSIRLVATFVHEQDIEGWQRLGARVADYHRAGGRVQQLWRRLGTRLDRLVIKTQIPDGQSIHAQRHKDLH
jgi:hypothetical protein